MMLCELPSYLVLDTPALDNPTQRLYHRFKVLLKIADSAIGGEHHLAQFQIPGAVVARGTYIFALPGSNGAVKDGWDGILAEQLDSRNRPCNFVDLMPRLREK